MLMEILAEMEKFPMNNCAVSFKAWKKSVMKWMDILPQMSFNKPLGKYFYENREIYGKFPRKYRRFGKFICIDGNFSRMIS
jgi:hypothetical protein